MNDPIYPDKTKTGLAALKPLLMAYCDEPERWGWEELVDHDEWGEIKSYDAVYWAETMPRQIRLTPKPRRVWIGDQSYPEPLKAIPDSDATGAFVFMADISNEQVFGITFDTDSPRHGLWLGNGLLFHSKEAARECLYAHRRARRVE